MMIGGIVVVSGLPVEVVVTKKQKRSDTKSFKKKVLLWHKMLRLDATQKKVTRF